MNDSLENLFAGDTGPVRTAPVRENTPIFTGAVERYEQGCPKCGGTGKFVGYTGRVLGNCFACKGAGKMTFKTSPETRAAARMAHVARKSTAATDSLAAFEAAHPQVWAWIKANAQKFDFATKMVEVIVRFGDLSAGQLAACQKMADRDAASAEQRIERLQNAPQVASEGVDRLKAAFDKARAYAAAKATGLTIRNPKITIGGMTISPAKATSANPGALYVKAGETYLGKIVDGQFLASRECQPEDQAKVLQFVADPAAAAKVYGQETGVCCVCNATLKSEWRLRGIGPVCAEKMGWSGLAEDFGVKL